MIQPKQLRINNSYLYVLFIIEFWRKRKFNYKFRKLVMKMNDLKDVKSEEHRIYSTEFLKNYFLKKIHKWDKEAEKLIFKEGEGSWERYTSLWKTNSKIWNKGKRLVYLYKSVDINGCVCDECRQIVFEC